MYRKLESDKIFKTAQKLLARIDETFKGSGLSKVAREIANAADTAPARIQLLRRPLWVLRVLNTLLGIGFAILGLYVVVELYQGFRASSLGDFIQIVEPALGSMVFVGAFILFVWGLEGRFRRERALAELHELRCLAHIIDMHQLPKAPTGMVHRDAYITTVTGAEHALTPEKFALYLDYCTELLSIVGKMAALYAQGLHEPVTLEAVDRLEQLTTGLSRKIWQKRAVLHDGWHGSASQSDSPVAEVASA